MQFMVHSQHKSAFCWAELELSAPGGTLLSTIFTVFISNLFGDVAGIVLY